MSDVNSLLAELRELLAKATPGPFYLQTGAIGVNPWIGTQSWSRPDGTYSRGGCILNMVAHDQREEDAALIVKTLNALPALLDALSPKEAELVKPPREYEVSGDAVGGGTGFSWGIEGSDQPLRDRAAYLEGKRSEWPSDGTCRSCGACPRSPVTGMCATCEDEWSSRSFSDPSPTPRSTASHDAARERIAPEALDRLKRVASGFPLHNDRHGVGWVSVRWDDLNAILAALPTTDGAVQWKHLGNGFYEPITATPPPTDASERMREAEMQLAPSHCSICEVLGVDHRGHCDEEGSLSNNEVSGDK